MPTDGLSRSSKCLRALAACLAAGSAAALADVALAQDYSFGRDPYSVGNRRAARSYDYVPARRPPPFYGRPRYAPDYGYNYIPPPRPRVRQPSRDPIAAEPAPRAPSRSEPAVTAAPRSEGPLFAVVSLSDQHITVYNHDGQVARSTVSTGVPGHPTPRGIFSIIGRERYHESNIYSGAPMPYMQRLTWSGVAMHQGVVPGYPASHGCIRLPGRFAIDLWGMTRIGERVVVSPHPIEPQAFTHAGLPVPKLVPEADVAAAASGVAQRARVADAGGATAVAGAARTAGSGVLNPIQLANLLKTETAAAATAAVKAERDALTAAGAASGEARAARAELASTLAAKQAAEARTAGAQATLDSASDNDREAATAALDAARSAETEAAARVDQARASEVEKSDRAFETVRLWKAASAAIESTRQAARDAVRRTAPVSVLVSKKDQRIYVRQGLAPVFDAPVVVANADQPLGTHLFIASATADDGRALAWTVLSLPAESAAVPEPQRRKRGAMVEAPKPSTAHGPPSTAGEALSRVEIPQEIRERIAELVWTGASLTISDHPLSGETSEVGTDLVVTQR